MTDNDADRRGENSDKLADQECNLAFRKFDLANDGSQ
jgi:hypothetical protein